MKPTLEDEIKNTLGRIREAQARERDNHDWVMVGYYRGYEAALQQVLESINRGWQFRADKSKRTG